MQVLDAFKECTLSTFVDGTLGAGGHSAALLRAHPEMKVLLGIDKDPVAHTIAEQTLQAAAAGREPPLDIRQIQVGTSASYAQEERHAELCESARKQSHVADMLACNIGTRSVKQQGTDGLQGTFADLSVLLEDAMQQSPENVADGILLDLGMSSMQAGVPLDTNACSPVSLFWLQQALTCIVCDVCWP